MINVGAIVGAINVLNAIDYNQKKFYSKTAIKIIQRRIGAEVCGVFDVQTISAIYNWQKSPKRLKNLTADGMFGSSSLGVMIAEMDKKGDAANASVLRQFPHKTLGGEIKTNEPAEPVTFLQKFPDSELDLRRNPVDDNRWVMKGSFRVEMSLDEQIVEPWRYEYRQFIKGRVYTHDGLFGDGAAKKIWQPRDGAVVEEANDYMKVPNLSRDMFYEDGEVMRNRTIERFGYRSKPPAYRPGLMDYYTDNQLGWYYYLQDTFGLEGARKRDSQGFYRTGLKIGVELQFRGIVIKDGKNLTTEQINQSNWKNYCVASEEWDYKGEKIVDW